MSLADRHLSHRLAAKYGTGGRLGWQSAYTNLRPFFPLEELRAGSEQRLDHTDTVFPGTASGSGNLPLRFCPVLAGRFDQMEVVLASASIVVTN